MYLRALGTSLDAGPNESGIEMLKRVVELDSRFAPAWSALGRRYLEHGSFGRGGSEYYELSESAYQRALALDPQLMDAAAGLAAHWTEKGELTAAYDVAREMLARQPGSLVGHTSMAYVLRFGGLHRESAWHCERGFEIDHHDPRLGHGVLTYLAMEEYEGVERFLKLRAGMAWADNIQMFVHLHRGQTDEALKVSKRLLADPAFPARFVAAFLENRPESEVARLADEYVQLNARLLRDPESSFLDATLMSYCGLVERSLTLFRAAVRGGYCGYPNLETDPIVQNVRRSPEYPALLSEARARHEAFVSYRNLASSPPVRSSQR